MLFIIYNWSIFLLLSFLWKEHNFWLIRSAIVSRASCPCHRHTRRKTHYFPVDKLAVPSFRPSSTAPTKHTPDEKASSPRVCSISSQLPENFARICLQNSPYFPIHPTQQALSLLRDLCAFFGVDTCTRHAHNDMWTLSNGENRHKRSTLTKLWAKWQNQGREKKNNKLPHTHTPQTFQFSVGAQHPSSGYRQSSDVGAAFGRSVFWLPDSW